MILAVDGPAASGKGTLARRLATHYGLAYLDTGRTYRAVAAALVREGARPDDEGAALDAARRVDLGALDDPALGASAIGDVASRVAVIPELRRILVDKQRRFAHDAVASGGGAVLDGRDIGTVVLPDAHVKLYVVADVAERARRRTLEFHGTETGPAYEAILAALTERDARDASRAASPLRPAADAIELDTTRLDAQGAFRTAVRLVDNAVRL